jgi:hypothetical protein
VWERPRCSISLVLAHLVRLIAMPHNEIRSPAAPGTVLAGRYRVERVIGIGGMGVVMAATHLQLDQPVAIKFLQPDALSSPDVVARFMREARAAVRIKSEHVARVLDVGALDSGAPYMAVLPRRVEKVSRHGQWLYSHRARFVRAPQGRAHGIGRFAEIHHNRRDAEE